MIEIAQPHLLRLAGQTGESASLAALDGIEVVYVLRVPVRSTSSGRSTVEQLCADVVPMLARTAERISYDFGHQQGVHSGPNVRKGHEGFF